ncbi:MAG: LTA synthase family protein [Atopobiaceae bacterium]|nr:LTA synthase family protein [Atopobiaceae bacterium]
MNLPKDLKSIVTAESRNALLERAALPLALVWLEVVFKTSTTGEFVPQLLFVLLFSCVSGMLANLAVSFLPSKRACKVAKTVLCALVGVIFAIEYFVYRQFKLFYDLNTVLVGAGDAATGFTDQIVSLVASPTGIVHVALFALPAVLYGLFGRGEVLDVESAGFVPTLAHKARNCGIVWVAALLAVSVNGAFMHSYTDQYTFQSAVTNFGLLTGLRKEVMHLITGSGSTVSFSAVAPSVTDEDDSSAEGIVAGKNAAKKDLSARDARQKAKPSSYKDNKLDIDFAALADSTDGTWADLDRYVAGLAPSSQNAMTGRFKGYNLIFVSAEAFSAEAIREDTTPTLWRMANKGIQFVDYYQFDSAGTTGGECANIFGLLPTEGGSSVKNTATFNNYYTMGSALGRMGYNGWAFHNNTYTYYDRDATHNNLGYSNGYMGYGNGMEQWVTWQWPQSDLEMVKGTFDNLYGNKASEPFNVYYMSVSGHSGYAPGDNAMSIKHWDKVKDLPYSDPVKGYLACNIELDEAMRYLVKRLKKLGIDKRTVIVIGADHFPYGLDDDGPLGSLPYTSELYGYDVQTYFQRDHNRLIVWSASLEKDDPIKVESPTAAIDILPTLLNLFGCEWDSRLLPGRDVFSNKPALVFDLSYDWKSDLGTYYANTQEFVPNEGAQIPQGYVEATCADVANRINYCRGVLTTDYYRLVFGDPA